MLRDDVRATLVVLANPLRRGRRLRALFVLAAGILVWILYNGEPLIVVPVVVLLWVMFGLME